MTKQEYSGSCLCGSIRFQVSRIEPNMAHCHCRMCRKFHGAAFATFGEAKKENFKWLQGKELLQAYVAENQSTRQFCGKCGSSMTFAPERADDVVEFSLATLDDPIKLRPDAHIFTNYKADWDVISDDLVQFPEGRKSAQQKVD